MNNYRMVLKRRTVDGLIADCRFYLHMIRVHADNPHVVKSGKECMVVLHNEMTRRFSKNKDLWPFDPYDPDNQTRIMPDKATIRRLVKTEHFERLTRKDQDEQSPDKYDGTIYERYGEFAEEKMLDDRERAKSI